MNPEDDEPYDPSHDPDDHVHHVVEIVDSSVCVVEGPSKCLPLFESLDLQGNSVEISR